MQKKLLTMAVAGALAAPCIALAQSSVEVYGTINMAFGKFKFTDGALARTPDGAARTTVGSDVSKWDVANGASNYGVRGRENVGGGLTAWFQIEQNAPLERSSNQAIKPASRNSAVGLQGNFGNVFVGQWTTPWADLDSLWAIGTVGFWGPVTSIIGRRETTGTAPNFTCVNAEGTVPGGSALTAGAPICDALQGGGGVGHAFWRRASNAIFYQSPVFAGVQVKAMFQTDDGKATAIQNPGGAGVTVDASAWSTSVQWAGMGGRARIGAAFDRHKDFTTPGQADTGWSVKGGWNFGVADVGVAIERNTYKCGIIPFGQLGAFGGFGAAGARPALCAGDGDIKAKQYGIALAVPIGQGSIRASYSKAKDLEGVVGTAAGVHISDTGAKELNFGYEHRFSKRSSVGVGYAGITNGTNAQFTWTGAPPDQRGFANTPVFGTKESTYFVTITHRF